MTCIEVICSTGDRAEAWDVESAVSAARTMVDDHWRALPVQGRTRGLTISFLVEGVHSRTVTPEAL